jgi:pyruvate,orthophosphate dikinase
MKALLGGKGANLAEMASLGLPVPPGFTITTEVCTAFTEHDGKLPDGVEGGVTSALAVIERQVGRKFGDAAKPLLVSVRSGAPVSMPGMMDTVLNLGLNDATVEGLAAESGDARFAYDSYRRFIQMYGNVVLGMGHGAFEELLDDIKDEEGVFEDAGLSAAALKDLVGRYRKHVKQELGRDFPQDPSEQLWGAIRAVFESWMNQRAIDYRTIHDIPDNLGTAVNVQAMVFGNMGEDCATGVAFTRNPDTGAKTVFGEFLVNAQGEDVVAGLRTPHPIQKPNESNGSSMEEVLPGPFAELMRIQDLLERHYRDMQDVEFTVEKGKLWMLQTRGGKRGIQAALKIATDMVAEGLITKSDALLRIDPKDLDRLLHPVPDPKAPRKVIARGLPGSPGAASGIAVFTSDEAQALGADGTAVILVRPETSPEDIHGMHAARGILTNTAARPVMRRSSHAAWGGHASPARVTSASTSMAASSASATSPSGAAIPSPSTVRPAR